MALFLDSQRRQKPWRYLPQKKCTETESKKPNTIETNQPNLDQTSLGTYNSSLDWF
tara:strand:- start:379 stop:546 length:168 start_codon:yes stop_codon:yes gene_type:complete